jgi:hypothetical protein
VEEVGPSSSDIVTLSSVLHHHHTSNEDPTPKDSFFFTRIQLQFCFLPVGWVFIVNGSVEDL